MLSNRYRLLVGVIAALAAAIAAVTIVVKLRGRNAPDAAELRASPPVPTVRGSTLAKLPLKAAGGTIDVGNILPCAGDQARTVKLQNTSDKPVEVMNYASNCGCLSAVLRGGMVIAPGESRDLDLVVHPQGYGDRSVSVEFAARQGLVGKVRVDYHIRGAVYTVPMMGEHSRAAKPEAIDFELVSDEGRAFKVLKIDPMVGEIVKGTGPRALVRLSTYEIEEFAKTPQGARHPGIVRSPDGSLQRATIVLLTDDPACPDSEVTITFLP